MLSPIYTHSGNKSSEGLFGSKISTEPEIHKIPYPVPSLSLSQFL